MGWFVNLSTRAKLFLGFGAMWLLLAVVIATAAFDLAALEEHDLSSAKALKLQELRSHENYARGQILEMTLATDRARQEAFEKNIRGRTKEIDEIIESLLRLNPDEQDRRQLTELKGVLAEYRQTREKQIALVYQGRLEEARQLGTGVQEERYTKIRGLATKLGQKAHDRLDKLIEQSAEQASRSTKLFVVAGLTAFILGLGMILLLNRAIVRPLGTISVVAGRVAGGDLTVDVHDEGRQDEVGALARTFRQMVEKLRRSTAEIAEAVSLLGASAGEIVTATSQVAAGTAETASAISETTTTVEEVRQAAQLSAKKAQDVSGNAQGVAQVAQSGEKAVEETAAGMDRIREEMESIARTIILLSEQGQSIGGIIATVTDLADQSNLLAVNAAIEAAKAGEQGRGFAVVAQEIKSLAEQSKQATAQVRTILNDVQKATSAAVMATEQGSKAVAAGVRQAAQAGEAIRALAESSGRAAQAATQIAVSSQQQVVGMDQVGVAMENINQAGAQTASTMRQMETAARNLGELGQSLKRLVEQYQL